MQAHVNKTRFSPNKHHATTELGPCEDHSCHMGRLNEMLAEVKGANPQSRVAVTMRTFKRRPYYRGSGSSSDPVDLTTKAPLPVPTETFTPMRFPYVLTQVTDDEYDDEISFAPKMVQNLVSPGYGIDWVPQHVRDYHGDDCNISPLFDLSEEEASDILSNMCGNAQSDK